MTTEITLHTVNEEPRVLDTDLAERLGMAQPLNIRTKLIASNRTKLETYGDLFTRTVKTGGRPETVFYLNEEQALLICMWSKTPNAALVRKQVISTFMTYRRGQLVPVQQTPALPDFSNPVIAARAWADAGEKRLAAEVIDYTQHTERDRRSITTRIRIETTRPIALHIRMKTGVPPVCTAASITTTI